MALLRNRPAKAKTRKPVVRTVRLSLAPFEGNPGIVSIRAGAVLREYFLWTLAAAFGTAFRLERFASQIDDGEEAGPYDVNLGASESSSTCECKGHLRWGHCKHVGSLLTLRNKGKL